MSSPTPRKSVDFKPTTIARYTAHTAVSQSVQSVTTSEFDSLGTNPSNTRKKPKKKRSKSKDGKKKENRHECRVTGFPFTELKTGIHGKYFGPVDDAFRPHGTGEFHIVNDVDGSKFHFGGTIWENGFMVSSQLMMFRRTMEGDGMKSKKKKKSKQMRQSASTSSSTELGVDNSVLTSQVTNSHEYSLGEIARSRTDMIIAPDSVSATEATSTLHVHDKAFLQRSNGLWTVAMLADRSMQPKNSYRVSSKWYSQEEIGDYKSEVLEESLLFVINVEGGTKIVPVSGNAVCCHWSDVPPSHFVELQHFNAETILGQMHSTYKPRLLSIL
jgi:hypothetical protein